MPGIPGTNDEIRHHSRYMTGRTGAHSKDRWNSKEIVLPDGKQAYPEYLVEYKMDIEKYEEGDRIWE